MTRLHSDDRTPADGENRFIGLLDENSRQHLLHACIWVSLPAQTTLMSPGIRMQHAYFPTRGIITLLLQPPQEKALALALIGDEGLLDVPVLLGIRQSLCTARMQYAGGAWRIQSAALLALRRSNPLLSAQFDRYIAVRHAQLAQAVLCHGFHSISQRLAKLLLMLADRLHATEFHITQLALANLLGVRRVGITMAAGELQASHIMSYQRGQMQLLNPVALATHACTCYALDQRAYRSMLMAPH